MKKLNTICKSVLKVTDEDFKNANQIADEQIQYFHPMKNGKAAKINDTGRRNKAVIAKLKELQELLLK